MNESEDRDILEEAERKEARERKTRWKDLPAEPTDPELLELRQKLFAREIAIVNKLRMMLDGGQYSAREMMKVISDAIVSRASADNRFKYAMTPMVEQIVSKAMQTRKNEFIDLLFPLMGPSIRKSIAENLRSMLNSFSQSLEDALSWRGIRWRIEAIRAGKSFSEIVMIHTILYRVEQIFFIHSETGLILAHLTEPEVVTQDADMVGAMLTAINDFVGDCFKNDAHGGEALDSLRMGEFTIIVERRDKAYIACVVRGTPPQQLHGRVSDALDQLVVEYSDELADFNGDASKFTQAVRFLEPLLEARYAQTRKPMPTWGKALAILALLSLVGVGGFFSYKEFVFENNLEKISDILRKTPGIIEVSRGKAEGKTRFMILRDDFAEDPEKLIASNPDANEVTIIQTPFVSLEPIIVERRAIAQINMPETVKLKYDNGVITLKGEAPTEWIGSAKRILQNTPGVKWVNTEHVSDPAMAHVMQLIRSIEAIDIEFKLGKYEPTGDNVIKMQKAVDMLVELEYAASRVGLVPSVIVYGHSDSVGNTRKNYEISLARAQTLAAMLYERGSGIPIAMYGLGAQYPKNAEEAERRRNEPDQASRRIEIKIRLLQSTQVVL